jgi:allantoinase
VHVNEPGRTEWEGFATATRAAAAGGVTTILDMPLNSLPPTVDVAALEVKQEAAEGRCAVDVGFWGGAVPGNLADLRGLHDAGVFGFKCFLVSSGVDEFPPLSARS